MFNDNQIVHNCDKNVPVVITDCWAYDGRCREYRATDNPDKVVQPATIDEAVAMLAAGTIRVAVYRTHINDCVVGDDFHTEADCIDAIECAGVEGLTIVVNPTHYDKFDIVADSDDWQVLTNLTAMFKMYQRGRRYNPQGPNNYGDPFYEAPRVRPLQTITAA